MHVVIRRKRLKKTSENRGFSVPHQVRFVLSDFYLPRPFMSVPTAGHPTAPAHPSFEIKSAQLPLVALHLRSPDWSQVSSDILSQFGPEGESPDFFDHDALVIDFSHLDAQLEISDIVPLLKVLRSCSLVPVAVRGASPMWMTYALTVGLVEAPQEIYRTKTVAEVPSASVVVQEVIKEVVREVVREVPGPTTMVIDKPLRSGQKIYARGADLVVLAMVNQGAEVVADGNIHVYAPLRGKAMAGARGNTAARIFSLCMEPELISIAGVYRTSENALPPGVHGNAAQVRLSDDGQEKLIIEALKA
jgi:septum site-determining protein MinC